MGSDPRAKWTGGGYGFSGHMEIVGPAGRRGGTAGEIDRHFTG